MVFVTYFKNSSFSLYCPLLSLLGLPLPLLFSGYLSLKDTETLFHQILTIAYDTSATEPLSEALLFHACFKGLEFSYIFITSSIF